MARTDGVPDPRNTEDIWEGKIDAVLIGFPDPANPGKSSPASTSNPMPVTFSGTLSVNTGALERRAVVSQTFLDLSDGMAKTLAVPPGATCCDFQPQGSDVRLRQDGTAPTATRGKIFGADGVYDLYLPTGAQFIATNPAAGVGLELTWRV